MKAISLLILGLMLISAKSMALSPIYLGPQGRDEFNSFDRDSKRALIKWFNNNRYVGEYGTTGDHPQICDWNRDQEVGNVWITESAYSTDGAYGVYLPNSEEGFTQITKAFLLDKSAKTIIILLADDKGVVKCENPDR